MSKELATKIEQTVEEISRLHDPIDSEIAKLSRDVAKLRNKIETLQRKKSSIMNDICKRNNMRVFQINQIMKGLLKSSIEDE